MLHPQQYRPHCLSCLLPPFHSFSLSPFLSLSLSLRHTLTQTHTLILSLSLSLSLYLVGRILNRFTKDQSQADEALPITLFDSLQSAFYCISVLLLICVSIPYLIILMPFLILLFDFVRNKYLINSIEIKRLEAISRSPIYVDFSSALEGLVTLRGYKLEKATVKSFQKQLDINTRAWFSFLMVSRWVLHAVRCPLHVTC